MKTIGFLGVAHIHSPGFINRVKERAAQFKVKAVWDTQPARAKIAAEQLSCSTAADYSDILNDREIDAVIICSETSVRMSSSRNRWAWARTMPTPCSAPLMPPESSSRPAISCAVCRFTAS